MEEDIKLKQCKEVDYDCNQCPLYLHYNILYDDEYEGCIYDFEE